MLSTAAMHLTYRRYSPHVNRFKLLHLRLQTVHHNEAHDDLTLLINGLSTVIIVLHTAKCRNNVMK